MKRLYTLIAVCLSIVTAMVAAPSAQAATSTCSVHQANIVGWNIQDHSITGHWDFQCGGANNDPWRITYSLQVENNLLWITAQCSNGQACASTRPTSGNPPFSGGSEHSGNFTFVPDSNYSLCNTWRVHAHVVFNSGDVFNTNGPLQAISNC